MSVSGLNNGVIAIDAGGEHTCALLTGGLAKCWGNNENGQIGRDTSPVTVLFAAVADKTYTYGDSSHKHAVTSLSTGETYIYDANGNMTQRVEGGQTYTQVFDAENRLVSVTVNSQTTQFIYDGDGNMVKKINPDGSKTIYVGGLYEVDKSSGGSVTRTVTYYPAAGAMRIDGTLYYILKDHLGSASVTTDASGNIVGEQRYNPYGETRLPSGSMFTDKLFTGQREMEGLGIYHYGARFYSPKLARFISADTIVPGGANPQSFNRYSYVNNNPIRFNDPSGHDLVDKIKQNKKNYGKLWNQFSKAWNRDGTLPTHLEEKWSLEEKLSNGSLSGNEALIAISKFYNINLAPGDSWAYEDNIDDGSGQIYGWTPRSFEEGYSVWVGNRLVHKTANDSTAIMTGGVFPFCNFNISCIAGIMAHEAVHSWIEYKIDNAGGWRYFPNQYELNANEEIFADVIATSLLGDTAGKLAGHAGDIFTTCAENSWSCNDQQATLQDAYGIDLSDLAVSISP